MQDQIVTAKVEDESDSTEIHQDEVKVMAFRQRKTLGLSLSKNGLAGKDTSSRKSAQRRGLKPPPFLPNVSSQPLETSSSVLSQT